MNPQQHQTDRREFIKYAGAATALSALAVPRVFGSAGVNHNLQIALIGCGGRGTGAVVDALTASGSGYPTKLVAMGDVFQHRERRLGLTAHRAGARPCSYEHLGAAGFEQALPATKLGRTQPNICRRADPMQQLCGPAPPRCRFRIIWRPLHSRQAAATADEFDDCLSHAAQTIAQGARQYQVLRRRDKGSKDENCNLLFALPHVACGSKAVNLRSSICFPLCPQKGPFGTANTHRVLPEAATGVALLHSIFVDSREASSWCAAVGIVARTSRGGRHLRSP